MDAILQLELEFDGIKDCILQYSSKGNIGNYVRKLDVAIKQKDTNNIYYFLEKIVEWYNKNLSEMSTNQFVFNIDEHRTNAKFLEKINKKITNTEVIGEHSVNKFKSSPLIFLSHESNDKAYGDILRNFITGIGVKNKQLIYTSHELHKIPLDCNIYQYLRNNISNKIFMIILMSDKYLESPPCLTELGAAWVTQCDYSNVFVPDFDFDNSKYKRLPLDTDKLGIVLNGNPHCKASMIELKDKIVKIFDLAIEEKEFIYLLDFVIKEMENING